MFGPTATHATVPPTDPVPTDPAVVTVPILGDDLLGCAALVFDPTDLADAALDTAANTALEGLGADLHVRIERTLDGDIDGRQAMLERECDGWLDADGFRATNLLVVMVSPTERATSIYFGSDYVDELTTTSSQIQEYVMNPRFKDGDVEGGLVAGLETILDVVNNGGTVPGAQDPVYDPTDFTYLPYEPGSGSSSATSNFSSSGTGIPGSAIAFFVVIVIVVIGINLLARAMGWESASDNDGHPRRSSSWGSSSRSFSSSSRSSSSRSSSGSSSRSSSRGGGGGSSRW
jgi:uncharacterized membrane protein YgcG